MARVQRRGLRARRGKRTDANRLKPSCVRKVGSRGWWYEKDVTYRELKPDTQPALPLEFGEGSERKGEKIKARALWVVEFPNAFGLPSGPDLACPDATDWCASVCYALAEEKSWPGLAALLKHNWDLLQGKSEDEMFELLYLMLEDFDHDMAIWGLDPREQVFRIHWDGDFFSLAYARAWRRVVEAFPHIRFWAYTRSFQTVNVVPILADLPNLQLFLSLDQDNYFKIGPVLDQHPREQFPNLRLAPTAMSKQGAEKLLPDGWKGLWCPENAHRIPLMGELPRGCYDEDRPGVGACVVCQFCLVPGKRAVLFTAEPHEVDLHEQLIPDENGVLVGAPPPPDLMDDGLVPVQLSPTRRSAT